MVVNGLRRMQYAVIAPIALAVTLCGAAPAAALAPNVVGSTASGGKSQGTPAADVSHANRPAGTGIGRKIR